MHPKWHCDIATPVQFVSMCCIELTATHRLGWALAVATAFPLAETAFSASDPTLQVNLARTSRSLVLSWVGVSAVPYQVEAGSALTGWTNASPVMTGTGSQLSFTNSLTAQSRQFFRVKRVFPASPGSAAFDPATGLLTIVGDALHTVINVANDGTGVIVINGGAMPITGGVATVSNTVLIQVLGSPGDDQITVGSSLPPAHIFGAEGNDTLNGGSGIDMIVGGPGNDAISGRQGNDILYLDGGDTVIWNPGDGSDLVEGQGGNNTLVFNGANVSENITLSANGSRLRLTRDVAAISLDVNGVQTVNIQALGGADNLAVDSLAGTAVTQVNIDLAAAGGGGDGQADAVTINGTASPDTINIAANAGAVGITGLAAQVQIAHPEVANDTLIVNGLGGIDSFSLGPGVTALIGTILNQ